MKKIDNIFKEGLDNKGLAYSEAHWDAMAAMLDANKVGFFARNKWLLGLLSLLLTSGIIAFFIFKTPQNQTANTNLKTDKNVSSMISEFKEEPTTEPIQQAVAKVDKHESGIEVEMKLPSKKPLRKIGAPVTQNAQALSSSSPIVPQVTLPLSSKLEFNQAIEVEELFEHSINLDVIRLEGIDIKSLHSHSATTFNQISVDQNKGRTPLSFYIAPYIAGNNYTKNYDELSDSKLKSAESPIYSIGYGIDFQLKRNNWIVKSGIGFVSLKEQTNYLSKQNTYGYDTSFRLLNEQYAYTPRGTRIALIEEHVDTFKTGELEQVECEDCITKFSYVTVPLAIQYELVKNRMIYFGEVGMNASFLKNSAGNYTFRSTDSTQSYRIEEVTNHPSLTKVLVYAQASAGVKYRISSKLNAYASYGFSKGLNSMMADYDQRAVLNQIRIGFEFKIK